MEPSDTTYGYRGATWIKRIVVAADEEIVQVADETNADLVVVGSNRHNSLHNLVLGSTAAYLATHSRAPVLVMRSRGAISNKTASVGAAKQA